MVENLGLVGEESFAAIGANGKRQRRLEEPRVGLGDDRGTIDTSLEGRLDPVGVEEPVGEPIGDLELLGELSRRPFASRPTRIEVLRVQALPGGGEARYHVAQHPVIAGEVVGR